jgi:GNAT superfamily N-acetyltransferase
LSGCQQLPVKHGLFLLVQGFMLVARAPDGSPIGVAYASSLLSLEHGGASGWIEELYVLPQWRGRGIGSRLITEVVARAKESGCARSTWKWKQAINERSRCTVGINFNLILGADSTGFSEMGPRASKCWSIEESYSSY